MAAPQRYSVVIPTRNRQRYCLDAVRSVVRQQRNDVQIIVLDNSDDDSLRALLDETKLSRHVDYIAPETSMLAMNVNWERALAHLRGDWVMYLGDDDGCMPDCFATLDIYTRALPFQVYHWTPSYYKWPCFPTNNRGLFNTTCRPPSVAICLAEHQLAQNASWAVPAGGKWPGLHAAIYHGLVSKALILKIKAMYGNYFYNNIADYASGLLNLTQIDYYPSFTFPLTIMGASSPSNTATSTGIRTEAEKKEQDDFFLFDSDDYAEFRGSRFTVPFVIARYKELFALIGRPFNITPEQTLKSCMAELSKIRDVSEFHREQRILLDYAARHQLSELAATLQAMQPKENKYYVGYVPPEEAFYIDTLKLGIEGLDELCAAIPAFCVGYDRLERFHRQMVQQIQAKMPPAPQGKAAS